MKLENAFEVPASPEATWDLLNDVPRVIPCMPGAALDEVVDDDNFKVTMHVKMGPIALQFATDIKREESDDAARSTKLSAKARDVKGRGGATATIESSLEPADQGTRVLIVTDLQMQGTLASTGRGIVGDVANQLTKRFADCIASQLQGDGASADATADLPEGVDPRAAAQAAQPPQPGTSTPAVKPVGGLGLLFGAIFRPITRLFRRR